MAYVISYDIGTTGVKTCLFDVSEKITLITSAQKGYNLYIDENGGAEQDADEWWDAMRVTTKELFENTTVKPTDVKGISFCTQMQGLVLVDGDGNAVRRPMSYLDQRAKKEIKKGIAYGIQIAGANIFKLIKSVIITGAVSSSVKDPLWKYKWVQKNEPENFARVRHWVDVKEYLLGRCTGNFVMTEDSAYSTFLMDTRKGKNVWSDALIKTFGVKKEHLPKIVKCTDNIGGLTQKAAKELGLPVGLPVFGGGGDATLIGIGAGCVSTGDTHVYCGTSGWVSTIVDKQMVDGDCMIAAIVGAQSGKYNYFAEMETAGKCLEWVKDHLALDEIGIYLQKTHVAESQEAIYTSLYDYLTETVKNAPAGSRGVIFAPWLHGNRCPFEDPLAAGMFFNIKLDTGKTELIRAVLEGVCYHIRWMLTCQDKKIHTSETIRFVGGGALSEVTCQILADMTGRVIETVDSAQNVGAVGAAVVCGIGLGLIDSFGCAKKFIPATKRYYPNEKNKAVYDNGYKVFTQLYKSNKKNFQALNS